MTGFWFQFVALLAAVNPPGAALADDPSGPRSLGRGALAAATALVVLALAALGADPLLDALEVSPESFRTAAGIVMAAQGARMAWDPRSIYRPGRSLAHGVVPLGWPVVANAAAVMTTISFAADGGDARVVATAAIPCLVAGLAVAFPRRSTDGIAGAARLLGAILVAGAAAVIVSGVRDV